MKKVKKPPLFWRFLKIFVVFFYRKKEYIGTENLPNEACIVIGNHSQAFGPMCAELYYPRYKQIWCRGEMLKLREVPAYAYEDFWSKKPKAIRWLYKIISYLIALPASYVLKHSDTLAVYKDSRIINTFKNTSSALSNGFDVVIFPEGREKYNEIVNEFQDKFVDTARMHYKKTKKAVNFVPLYIAPYLKKAYFGKPIKYNPDIDIEEMRKNICDHLKNEITRLAKELPRHKVVPYDNISKKNYPYSK